MTKPEIEALIRSYYRLVDAGDIDGLVALFSDTAEYRRPGYPPLNGKAALATFYREQRVIREGEHRLEFMVVDPPRAAVHGSFAGTLRDGEKVSLEFADHFEITSRKIARRWTFFFEPRV